ncbi:hypothetical protein [Methylomonas sp. 11b]|uniref:hypothetical protein n=1 Tax=Methylomonas sp. 11b TaxID=1168169 RepID=UPI00047EC26E|nr:hypothetical protein [Methylomonas sp. 11b]
MKTLLLAASLLLIASVPALAAPQTYSRTIVTNRDTQMLVEDFHVVPGAASSAASALDGSSATATADFGVVKLSANAPTDIGFAQAIGSFRDTITLSGTGPVPITISFLANGVVTNHNPGVGDWSYDVALHLQGNFTDLSRETPVISTATGNVSIPLSISGSAFAGVPLDLFGYFAIYSSGNTFSAFGLDFAHTALLTGIDVPDGVTVTSATYGLLPTSNGQFTYQAVKDALVPVPVPALLPVFGLGFSVAALARCRRIFGGKGGCLLS